MSDNDKWINELLLGLQGDDKKEEKEETETTEEKAEGVDQSEPALSEPSVLALAQLGAILITALQSWTSDEDLKSNPKGMYPLPEVTARVLLACVVAGEPHLKGMKGTDLSFLQLFEVENSVSGGLEGTDQFVELDLYGNRVAVLAVLN